MPKNATQWHGNASKFTTLTAYSAAVAYSAADVAYSNPNESSDEWGKSPQLWATASKQATGWTGNASSVSTDTYEPAAVTYDTIYTAYDGNQNTTASTFQDKIASVWAEA